MRFSTLSVFFSVLLFTVPVAQAQKTAGVAEPLKVLSANFGGIHYHDKAALGGSFDIKPTLTRVLPEHKYFAWLITATCPRDVESIAWRSVYHLPRPDTKYKPSKDDDDSVKLSDDRKSWITDRKAFCKDGKVRIDDIYGRSENEIPGAVKLEVFYGDQRLASFNFELVSE
jgi:hypothetical protein